MSAIVACSAGDSQKSKREPVVPGDEYWSFDDDVDQDPITPDEVNDNSGAFTVNSRPKEAGAPPAKDAGTVDSGVPAPTKCISGIAAGDLAIVELTIASRPGSGDPGEWFEVKSMRTCILDIGGVVITSPRGTATDSVTIPTNTLLNPGETFVVADTLDTTKNNGLPSPIFAFEKTDVLKNDGDTISITKGATTIDALTYPKFSLLSVGVSLAFPSDCPAGARSDWARWSVSQTSFATSQKGTPNAPNADVTCF